MQNTERAALKYVGNTYDTNESGPVVVIGYEGYKKVLVKFIDGTETYCRSGDLLNGEVWNPMQPSKFGRGFFGQGPHLHSIGKVTTKEYSTWGGIFYRLFDEKALERKPTYKEVGIVQDWYNFQEYAEWCQWQKGFKNEGWQLDKDLINKGSKEYSPENCCWVPREVNMALISQKKQRGSLPIGVTTAGHRMLKYRAQWCEGSGQQYSPIMTDPMACYEIYKKNKERYMHSLAAKWAGLIDERAEYALSVFEVDIND